MSEVMQFQKNTHHNFQKLLKKIKFIIIFCFNKAKKIEKLIYRHVHYKFICNIKNAMASTKAKTPCWHGNECHSRTCHYPHAAPFCRNNECTERSCALRHGQGRKTDLSSVCHPGVYPCNSKTACCKHHPPPCRNGKKCWFENCGCPFSH